MEGGGGQGVEEVDGPAVGGEAAVPGADVAFGAGG